MNSIQYIPPRNNSFTQYFRRSSLDTLKKDKISFNKEENESFRKSHSSFDKKGQNFKQQLPQIRYQKQMDSNIYFNQKTRTNFFKNLIDSYFQKNQLKRKTFQHQPNHQKKSHLSRKSLLNNRSKGNQQINQLLINNTQQNVQNHKNKQKTKYQNVLLNPVNQQRKNKSLRYKNYSQLQGIIEDKKGSLKDKKGQIVNKNQLNKQLLLQPHISLCEDFNEKSFPSICQTPVQYSFLPKITQAGDDGEDEIDLSQSISLNQDIHSFLRTQNSFKTLQQRKILVYQNPVIRLYQAQENSRKYRIKQFKNKIFLLRHKRALQCGVQTFWKSYKFHQLSLMIPFIFPIKDLLYKLIPHPTSPQYIHLTTKPLYTRLMSNNCQDLVLLFRQFIKDLSKVGKKVINNKINLSNIFYLNGKLCLGEWQYAAFKEENNIQGNHFQSRVEPILKCDKQWLVSPQYLSPQILESVQNVKKPFNLWQYQNASDIYSTGISFLEIITQIPIWMQHKAIVKQKIMKPRQGSLSTSNRSIARILEKQYSLVSRMGKILERQIDQNHKNIKFFNVLLKMIQPDPSKRIKMDEIISQLQ